MTRNSIIIFTSDLYEGGVAESTRKLAKILADDFDIIVCSYDSLPIKKPLPANITVINFNLPLSVGFRTNKFSRILVKLFRFGALPIALIKLSLTIKRTKCNVVYSMTYIPNLVNLFCSRFFSYRCILSERQDPREDLPNNSLLGKVLKKYYLNADYVHVNSQEMIGAVHQFYRLEHQKIFHFDNFFFKNELITNGFPVENIPLKNRFKVVTSGRLSKQKGQWHLIDLISRLRCRGVDIGLLILGEGELRCELQDLAKSLLIDDHVCFLGNVDNPHKYVAGCDLFVFSSIWESFGNTLAEAMALGVPVASTVCRSGPRQIIADGQYGLSLGIFPQYGNTLRDEEAEKLCDKLEHLLKFELEKYSLLSKEGYLRFDAEKIKPKLMELFSK